MSEATELIKAMVAGNNRARFIKYFDGCLWYEVWYRDPSKPDLDLPPDRFAFPVPVSDIGNATFLAEDKALLMMRYIRKHLQMLESAKTEVGA